MKKIRYTPFILILALLLNAMLPFVLSSPPIQHATLAPQSFAIGEKILLCTGEGLKWVSLADLQSGKEKPKPHSGDQCPLCSAIRHSVKDVLLPVASNLPPALHAPDAPIFVYATLFVSPPQTTSLNARAPPHSFIG